MARRAGGRQARHAQRSAPLKEAMKPVRPGERGGRFHPFNDQDLEVIVENIYRILEEVGFKDATPHCIETCEAVGAVLGEDGRLRMPRAVVDTALKHAKRNLTLHAQDPAFDLDLSGSRVHFATAGAALLPARTSWSSSAPPWRSASSTSRRSALRSPSPCGLPSLISPT